MEKPLTETLPWGILPKKSNLQKGGRKMSNMNFAANRATNAFAALSVGEMKVRG